MLLSLTLIFLCGLLLSAIFEKLKLPALLGMLVTGMLLGPYALDVLDGNILAISPDLRKIALIIILTRAGLNLQLEDLKKIGRPAMLLCFVPACFEILAVVLLAPPLLHISLLEAAIMGSVLAAVSPAIIVPKMLKIMEEGYSKEKHIPQMIMAGASVDDVFVIVLFTSFLSLTSGNTINATYFLTIPISILLGIGIGVLTGLLLSIVFKKIHIRDSKKVILVLAISFLLVVLEDIFAGSIDFSSLLAIMTIGITLQQRMHLVATRLSIKYSKLWIVAEILLFVLVGATVDFHVAIASGIGVFILLVFALLARMLGVFLCLCKTNLNNKERLFCMIAYCPKATVQAAIGSIPLSMHLGCGNIVLSVAVIAILITAPIGAFAIDYLYKKLLT